MKAWAYQTRGPVSKVLRLYHDLPKPTSPKADEVLIKVSHVVSLFYRLYSQSFMLMVLASKTTTV